MTLISKFQTTSPIQVYPKKPVRWINDNKEGILKRIADTTYSIIDIAKFEKCLRKRVDITKADFNRRKEDLLLSQRVDNNKLEKDRLNKNQKGKLKMKLDSHGRRLNRLEKLSSNIDEKIINNSLEWARCLFVIQCIHANKAKYHGECIPMLNTSAKMNMAPRGVTLDILKSIKWDINKMEQEANAKLIEIPQYLKNPGSFDEESFVYDEIAHMPIKHKYHYMPTFSYKSFCQEYGSEIPTLAQCEQNNFLRQVRGVHIMMRDVMNEARTVYIDTVIRGLIEGTMSNDPNHDISPCYSIPLYYIHKLLEKYDDWPYLETMQTMRYNTKFDMPTILPTLIYCLCNLQVHYILGNADPEFCLIAIDTWFKWAETCFNQEHLANKGNHTDPFKLLNEKLINKKIPSYNNDGQITGTQILESVEEVWYEGEKDKLIEKLELTRPLSLIHI